MPTRNVNLTDHLDRFIERGIASGRYTNASEVVREGLRLLQLREKRQKVYLQWLRGEAKKGFDQINHGEYFDINSDQDMERFFNQIHSEKPARFHKAKKRA